MMAGIKSAISKIYLLAYNFLQFFGWSLIFLRLVSYYLNLEEKNKTLWECEKRLVIVFQGAAALEIIHAVNGLVKSNPGVTTFQVLGRLTIIFAAIMATPAEAAAASLGVPIILTAWSTAEIIRYCYYFFHLMGYVPSFLTWLRYTAFIVLFPLGFTGEFLCVYAASKYAASNPDFMSFTLPNSWNFSFIYHYFLVAVMLSFIPVPPKLYSHMLAQRRKVLKTPDEGVKKVR